LFMFLSLLLMISPAYADEDPYPGNFTFLGKGEPAPFEGTLFDIDATATVLSLSEYYEAECDLEIEFSLDRQATEFYLERRNFEIRLDSLKEEYDLMITQKDLEIAQLQDSIKSQSPRNNWPWYVGGIATGVAMTYGAYKLFGE